MKEQERKKELPTKFPKVEEEHLFRLFFDFVSNPVDALLHGRVVMKQDEPLLSEFIESFAIQLPNPFYFTGGAYMAYAILHGLEKEGYSWPKVENNTIENFAAELDSLEKEAVKALKSQPPAPDPSWRELMLSLNERIGGVDRVLPPPNNYRKENPFLMEVFDVFEGLEKMGAMVVYELKRRQFFADQMKK